MRQLTAHLRSRGITEDTVLEAIERVPRASFVEPVYAALASNDLPLPLPHGQIATSPYVLARTLLALAIEPGHSVLEIGVGSGYATALLLELGAKVRAFESIFALAAAARERLSALGYDPDRWSIEDQDGSRGDPARAPFDRIVLGAAVDHVPTSLLSQLSSNGRMVLPLGTGRGQRLTLIEIGADATVRSDLMGVVFSPLIGEAGLPPPGVATPPRRLPPRLS